MNMLRLTLLMFTTGVVTMSAGIANEYEIEYSTFLGGSDWEHGRDICVDAFGNVYVVGGTKSKDFPTTESSFQRKHDMTGTRIGSGGYCDAFVAKFNADGKLVWSTLLGGPNYDRAYAVEVDRDGFVYVSGRGGPEFPVTDGAFQTQFQGTDNGIYGMQNGFVAKLKPDGSAIEWAGYVGVGQLCRDLSIDADGDVYVALHYTGKGPLPPKDWFANAFQPTPAGDTEIGALKIAGDGKSVRWATWLGGSGSEVPNCGIRIDDQKNVYLNFTTRSNDVPTTIGAHDRSHNGESDAFVAKLSDDGSKLMFGTYFGGAGVEEGNSTHNMAVDKHGNAYLSLTSDGTDMPVTSDVVQPSLNGTDRDIVVAKFSPIGALLLCTYLGGTGNDGPDGIYANDDGEVFFTGTTSSTDFPTSANAIQSNAAKQNDALLVVLSADFANLEFASYLGGPSYDDGRSCCWGGSGCLYITGSTNGSGWPVQQAHQPNFGGGGGGKELCYEGGCYAGDVIVTKIRYAKE